MESRCHISNGFSVKHICIYDSFYLILMELGFLCYLFSKVFIFFLRKRMRRSAKRFRCRLRFAGRAASAGDMFVCSHEKTDGCPRARSVELIGGGTHKGVNAAVGDFGGIHAGHGVFAVDINGAEHLSARLDRCNFHQSSTIASMPGASFAGAASVSSTSVTLAFDLPLGAGRL